MTRRDTLLEIRKAEHDADSILKQGDREREAILSRAREEADRIMAQSRERTDQEVAGLETAHKARVEQMREKSESVSRARAEALQRSATGKMPQIVDQLVDSFRKKAEERPEK